MFLTRLVYASTISDTFSNDDAEKILKKARENNKQSHITGMLCFDNKYFLQCLEGSRLDVNSTYHKILNDKRHCDIMLLEYKEIVMREFSNWSMGYITGSELTNAINLKYSGSTDFSPYNMSGEGAYLMMKELRNTTSAIS